MPPRLILLPFLLLAACDSNKSEDPSGVQLPPPRVVADADYTVTSSGLKYFDFKEGTGDVAKAGQQVQVEYTGWLTNGQVFDSSLFAGRPLTFILGRGQVIPGWDEGIAGMKVGGERQLVIPPALAYGTQGVGTIPPNSTLIFEVELVGITPGTGGAP